MIIEVIDQKSKWLDAVIALGDSCRGTVGFMPRQAFTDYAERKHIIGIIDGNTLVGYIMYRYKTQAIIIVHICVQPAHRKSGCAQTLVDYLFQNEKYNFSYMQLSCRRDYGIDRFWQSLGFTPIAEKAGRATNQKTVLTTWTKINPEYPSLFVCTTADSEKTTVVIDTNIAIDLCDQGDPETQPLSQPFLHEYVDFFVAPVIFEEINRNGDTFIRNSHRNFVKDHFDVISVTDADIINTISAELLKLKPTENYSNTWYDIQHLSYAIAFGSEVFVTRDSDWLREKIADEILEKYNLSIMSPGELIRSIDELNAPNAYSPLRLASLNLEYSEMGRNDFQAVVDVFYPQFNPARKNAFEKYLRKVMAGSASEETVYRLLIVKADDTPVCLIVYSTCTLIENVEGLYLNNRYIKGSLVSTFIKHIAFKLLGDAAKSGIRQLIIDTEGMAIDVSTILMECGFIKTQSGFARFILRDIVQPNEMTSIAELEENHALNIAIHNYSPESRDICEIVARTLDLEKILWPLKIDTDEIPCYIVPIRANYALELFDENLANDNISLFGSDKIEPALSIEKVYYKSQRNSIPAAPARILWYVSNDKDLFGTGAIRASSYLDAVEILDVKAAYKKYRRLGVLSVDGIKQISNGKQFVAIYKFSYTELFSHPVFLDDIRRIVKKQKATFQSYMAINNTSFLSIYQQGIKE